MSHPVYLPPPTTYGPRPQHTGARIHAGIALGVISIVGFFGSTVAFLAVAFMGDGCGFADSPPICSSAGAAWGLMLEPALATMIAAALALTGLVRRPPRHAWPVAAWVVWLAGGAAWVLLLSVAGVG
ncbi:hypothetical protein LQ327_29880 [Actinomycetospora endophytica]|uniref:Uncharacterized protein n=1 Tax=Actinomycetospora endophytica TaxID=2291215 RepID=A0ABS8PH47_9PSEU|nr:hypothetical protein [Actinomycetospora endophytica]MCD2197588.1 hypothetical protein [Actinomycetospora endophytica]